MGVVKTKRNPSGMDARSFSDKANPTRSAQAADLPGQGRPGDVGSYPNRCNPNRRRDPLTEEQRGLAARYVPMAQALARRMTAKWPSQGDELESTAYMALVEAVQTFDPTRNVNFATYARHRIRYAFSDYRRSLCSANLRRDEAHAPIFRRLERDTEEFGNARVLWVEPDRPIGEDIEASETAESWLRRLPSAQATACRLVYVDGRSQQEAAGLMGCSRSYFSRLHRDALISLTREYRATCVHREPVSAGLV